MDPAGLSSVDAAFTWTPGGGLPLGERGHARFKYRRFPWTVAGAWNRADFYDFFGPTKIGRKGWSLALQWERPLVNEPPRTLDLTLGAAGYTGLERMPAFQNVATTFDRFATASAELKYARLRRTIGAIEPEKGVGAKLGLDGALVRSEAFPQAHATLDVGLPLPPDHLSLWLRAAGGQAWGSRMSSFASFYFGGFGNNWVDHGEINRYREFDAFPGKGINAVPGRNFVRTTAELVLPPLRFARLGWPGLYANWARLALFTSGLAVDLQAERRELLDFGGQVNLKLVIFSSLESTLSLGYAMALERGERFNDELMVSLKILR
jgi:hypothetical protein